MTGKAMTEILAASEEKKKERFRDLKSIFIAGIKGFRLGSYR